MVILYLTLLIVKSINYYGFVKCELHLGVFKIEANVVTIQFENKEEYQRIIIILEWDVLDVVDYNGDISILVDDRVFYTREESLKTAENSTFTDELINREKIINLY